MGTSQSAIDFLRALYREIKADRIGIGAAALAYYSMLALFPAAIVGVSLLPYLPVPHLAEAISDLLHQLLPRASATLFADTVHDVVSRHHSGLLSFGLLFMVAWASSGVSAVMKELNVVLDVEEQRSFLKARGIAVALTLLLTALSLLIFGLVIVGGELQQWLAERLGWSSWLRVSFAAGRWAAITLAICGAFAVVYRVAPNRSEPFRLFSAGTLCATAGLLLASFGFRLYVGQFGSFGATYGSFGAGIMLLVWLFMLGWVILLGAEVDDLLQRRKRPAASQPGTTAGAPSQARPGVSPVVWAALAANVAIMVAKYVAAFASGSAGLMSEAIHSTADSGNGLLLALGAKLSHKPPDLAHPFGRGQEIYFWGLIVALVLFGLGGGMSFYEGFHHVLHPHPLEHVGWTYVVLAIALIAESTSFTIAARNMRRIALREHKSFWAATHGSKNPEHFVVLFEDAAALLGLALAFGGVYASRAWNMPALDGAASIGIGAILTIAAVMLAYECRSLLLGESADPAEIERMRSLAARDPAVERVGSALTMFLGPEQILVNLTVDFKDGLTSAQVEQAVQRLGRAIRADQPAVTRIFIEAATLTRGTAVNERTAAVDPPAPR